MAFRGHDESGKARNQGNFLELLRFLSNSSNEVNSVVLKNAPENHKLTSPDFQKDIVHTCVMEITNAILNELGDLWFAILVDESRDVSMKE